MLMWVCVRLFVFVSLVLVHVKSTHAAVTGWEAGQVMVDDHFESRMITKPCPCVLHLIESY